MSMSKVVSFVVGLVLLATTLPAFAGPKDGPTLINQVVVDKSGGFPYVITEPGSYQLTENLVVPADTNGIDIQSGGVTLDLNGFNIIGAIKCSFGTSSCAPTPTVYNTYGIFSRGSTNTVRNGHVSGFPFGVKAFGGVVENISVSENWYAGIEANDSVLRKNTATGNVRVGIQAFNSLITENTILDNGVKQVVLAGGGVFSHNIIRWYLSNGNDIGMSVVSDHTSSCIFSGTDQIC